MKLTKLQNYSHALGWKVLIWNCLAFLQRLLLLSCPRSVRDAACTQHDQANFKLCRIYQQMIIKMAVALHFDPRQLLRMPLKWIIRGSERTVKDLGWHPILMYELHRPQIWQRCLWLLHQTGLDPPNPTTLSPGYRLLLFPIPSYSIQMFASSWCLALLWESALHSKVCPRIINVPKQDRTYNEFGIKTGTDCCHGTVSMAFTTIPSKWNLFVTLHIQSTHLFCKRWLPCRFLHNYHLFYASYNIEMTGGMESPCAIASGQPCQPSIVEIFKVNTLGHGNSPKPLISMFVNSKPQMWGDTLVPSTNVYKQKEQC